MRLFGWALMQYDWCPPKKRVGHRCAHTWEEDPGEDSLLQAKERDRCWVLKLRLLVSGARRK